MGLIKHPPLTVFEGHARGVLNYPSGLVKRTHSMNSKHCCQHFNQILQSCASHRIHKQHGRLQGVQERHLPLKSHLRLPSPKLYHSFPLPEPQCNTGFQPPKENPADNHDEQSVKLPLSEARTLHTERSYSYSLQWVVCQIYFVKQQIAAFV